MEEAINDRIDDDRIGMIKMSSTKVEFVMITKTHSWETSMSTNEFLDTFVDDYGILVDDAVETLKNMVKYKGFVIDGNVMSLYLKENVRVKFPPFGEACPIPSFMWSAVTKDAGAHASVRAEEEQKRIEEQKAAEARERQRLADQYKRWKKKNPTALAYSVPVQFAPLFTAAN